jgi:adenosine deaminase
VALGADDPLLFHSRLLAQYAAARDVDGLPDAALADLARQSIDASLAADGLKASWRRRVDAWLEAPPQRAAPSAFPSGAPDEQAGRSDVPL